MASASGGGAFWWLHRVSQCLGKLSQYSWDNVGTRVSSSYVCGVCVGGRGKPLSLFIHLYNNIFLQLGWNFGSSCVQNMASTQVGGASFRTRPSKFGVNYTYNLLSVVNFLQSTKACLLAKMSSILLFYINILQPIYEPVEV